MVELPAAADDFYDMDDGMRCSFHPYRSNQAGICALCLQDKLGKLLSSSSSSSFRSDFSAAAVSGTGTGAAYSASSSAKSTTENRGRCQDNHTAKAKIPFLSKKKQPEVGFRRSKSTTVSTRGKFLDPYDGEVHTHKNRGWIWSLFDFSTKSHLKKIDHSSKMASKEKYAESIKDFSGAGTAEDDGGSEDSPSSSYATASVSSLERKVSRSRSVGCGSRSFSGDFFERITGFGDCTLRRVESHREGKLTITSAATAAVHDGGESSECLKERVKCGGIFGGFMIQTSSSSSSASSTYWVSSSSGEEARFPPHGQRRSKNRGWAFASPRRAVAKPPPPSSSSEKNLTPNLDAIPSFSAVRI